MSDRYDATIQLVAKVNNKYQLLDTMEVLKPYFHFDEEMFKQFGSKEEDRWMCSSFNFWPLFDSEEERKLGFSSHTKAFYWIRKVGNAVSGTYSWNFPLEALIKALRAQGYPEANYRWVRSTSFRGGCR